MLFRSLYADVVIFDPTTIIDAATYANPHQYPVGISDVVVNGVWTIHNGKPTGKSGGGVLKLG